MKSDRKFGQTIMCFVVTEKRNKVLPKLNNISKVDSFAISMMYNVLFFVFGKSLKTRTKFPVLLS